MSRTGNCCDNAVAECHEHFTTKHEARAAVFDLIGVFYNRERRHAAIGCVGPEQFEASRR